jgi:hypothetical protein
MRTVMIFKLEPRARAGLSELRRLTRASSDAEVLRQALTLLQLAQKSSAAGGQMLLRGADGAVTEVQI